MYKNNVKEINDGLLKEISEENSKKTSKKDEEIILSYTILVEGAELEMTRPFPFNE